MTIITNLLTNMIVVATLGHLPTNYSSKSTFHEYAFGAMFQQASNLAATWKLDLPCPITTNMVTFFAVRAHVEDGLWGSIEFSNRYAFGWDRSKLEIFNDKSYIEQNAVTMNVETNDAIYEQWMRATNHLTMKKARVIAESVMQSLDVPMGTRNFKKPDFMMQKEYEWKDGKKHLLPFYTFQWKGNHTFKDWHEYEVQVSGITSNVLHCFILLDSPYLKSIKPTNYFGLLGLPPNPVFVNRLPTSPGKPPVYEIYTNYLKTTLVTNLDSSLTETNAVQTGEDFKPPKVVSKSKRVFF